MRTTHLLAARAACILVASPVMAGVLPAIADTNTDSAAGKTTTNYGSNGIVAVAPTRIGLIRFDSTAITVSAGGTATLNLKVVGVKNWQNAVSVRLVKQPWNEKTVTAATLPTISPLVLDEKTIGGADVGKVVSFDITDALTAWRSDPSQNFGIALMPASPAPNLQFGARELKTDAKLVTGDTLTLIEAQKLATGEFIRSLAVDGNTAALTGASAVYIFTRTAGVWKQSAKLPPAFSVALAGNTLLLGQPSANVQAAYVWVRNTAGAWKLQAKLVATGGGTITAFGSAVALNGDTAVVGATSAGVAYVFRRTGTVWRQEAKLTPSGGPQFLLGESVAVSGETALIGSRLDNDRVGAAYVFTRSLNRWTQEAKLVASDGASFDDFGGTLALAGNTALIGGGQAAYVFSRTAGVWAEQAKLRPHGGAERTSFGNSVALDDHIAVIGARIDSSDGSIESGAAYVFTETAGVWTQEARLISSDIGSQLGQRVALDGDTAMASSGSNFVYVFARLVDPVRVTAASQPIIGAGTSLKAGSGIGDQVTIGENVTLGENLQVGNNVTIETNVVIDNDVVIDDGVFIGEATMIGKGSHICANASIGASSTISSNRLVATGAVVPAGSSLPGGSNPPSSCTPLP